MWHWWGFGLWKPPHSHTMWKGPSTLLLFMDLKKKNQWGPQFYGLIHRLHAPWSPLPSWLPVELQLLWGICCLCCCFVVSMGLQVNLCRWPAHFYFPGLYPLCFSFTNPLSALMCPQPILLSCSPPFCFVYWFCNSSLWVWRTFLVDTSTLH